MKKEKKIYKKKNQYMKLIQTGSDTAGLILALIFAGNHNFFSSAVLAM